MDLFRRSRRWLEPIRSISGKKTAESERILQEMVEKCLSGVFPGMEYIGSEYLLSDKRLDTVAFDCQKKTFVIIEYKNVRNKRALEQALEYRTLLYDDPNQLLISYRRKTGKDLLASEVRWDETGLILIAPEFTDAQIRAARADPRIDLRQITLYDEKIIALNQIVGDCKSRHTPGAAPSGGGGRPPRAPGAASSGTRIQRTARDARAGGYSIEGHLRGRPSAPLYRKTSKAILKALPDLEERAAMWYIGFYNERGRRVCSIRLLKKAKELILVYSFTGKDKMKTDSFVKYTTKGKIGGGDYESRIRSDGDVKRAILHVKRAHKLKARRDRVTRQRRARKGLTRRTQSPRARRRRASRS